jgi:hypothetical protein
VLEQELINLLFKTIGEGRESIVCVKHGCDRVEVEPIDAIFLNPPTELVVTMENHL